MSDTTTDPAVETGARPDAQEKPAATEQPKPDKPKAPEEPQLGEGGQKALEAERKARAKAEKDAKEARERLAELETAGKSKEEQFAERLAAIEAREKAAEIRAARAEVAQETAVPVDVLAGPKSQSAEDLAEYAAALNAFAETKRTPPATGGGNGGARPRPVTKDIDEQIVAAQKADDWALAGQLKAQKLGTAPDPNK